VLAVVSLVGAGVPARGDVLLVSRKATSHEIVRPKKCTSVVAVAAQELQQFVEKSTGVRLPLVTEPTPDKGRIFLGPCAAAREAGITPADLRPEGFHLKTVGNDVFIVGRDTPGRPRRIQSSVGMECGTLNGVYELLERTVGVMFCWHDELGTVVPKRDELRVPDLDVTDAPDWSYRFLAYGPAGEMRKMYGRRLRLGHAFSVSHAHAWHRILSIDTYGAEHPEYYAQTKGRRLPRYYLGRHGGQVCTTNPEVAGIFARAAAAYFNRTPWRHMFSISPNDGGGFCQCAACCSLDVEMDEERGGPVLTDRLITFYNAVARQLGATHPDKLLGAYVYSYYKRPPRRTSPHPNLALVLATNSAHAQGVGWDREQVWEREWCARTARMFKYDIYYWGRNSLNVIAPLTTHLAERLKTEHQIGLKGGYLYTGQSYEQLGAGHYLMAKLMWDRDADVGELERRYYKALYGGAAADVTAYYRLLEGRLRGARHGKIDVDEPAVTKALGAGEHEWTHAHMLAAYWPVLDQASAVIERAQSRELSDLERQRLQRLTDQHELLLATVRGMIAAGRLEEQVRFDADDMKMMKAAVAQRQAVRQRIKVYAPTLAEYLDRCDLRETARISPDGAFYQLARAGREPTLLAVRAAKPPAIDGRADDAAWGTAPFAHLLLTRNAAPPQLGARARLTYDDKRLYCLVEGREQAPAKLLRTATARDDTALFGDDNIEVFLMPPGGSVYYQLGLGAGGALYDAAMRDGPGKPGDVAWTSGATHAVHIGEKGWTAELAVPFAGLGAGPTADGEWRANVYRTRRGNVAPDEYTAAAATFGGYHVPERFARLRFVADPAPAGFEHSSFEGLPPDQAARRLRFRGDGGATLRLDNDVAYCGSHAAHIRVPKGGLGAITTTAPAGERSAYRVVVMHRNSLEALRPDVRPQAPIARVIFRGPGGKAVTESSGYFWDGAPAEDYKDQWRSLSLTLTTPPRTASISLTLFFHHVGEYRVDELRLAPLGP